MGGAEKCDDLIDEAEIIAGEDAEGVADHIVQPAAGKIEVDLTFESLDDFSPDRVAKNAEPLRKLLELRGQLADLRGKVQSNEKLEEILLATLSDDEKRNQLKAELEAGGGAGSPSGGA